MPRAAAMTDNDASPRASNRFADAIKRAALQPLAYAADVVELESEPLAAVDRRRSELERHPSPTQRPYVVLYLGEVLESEG